ncbi:hypothetical protein NQ317_010543 [Molorchus minor]|uniref:DUF5641 domain-containing protein n=1 Tax=Molorchus minor TaxID=1323400 RepID=A0ABQ9JSH4_9CUCU|nr:hypothetical protein NQ317_010543 [Molorchus minor]
MIVSIRYCYRKKDHLVDILIDYFHVLYLHTGPHLLLSLLRQRYWILAARSTVRKRLVQSFWNRWRVEYLNSLQIRQKWNTPSCPVTKGTLVLIMQDNIPPLQWPLGLIEETFPGKDGVNRVALVRCKNTAYKRPIVKLCPLPQQ